MGVVQIIPLESTRFGQRPLNANFRRGFLHCARLSSHSLSYVRPSDPHIGSTIFSSQKRGQSFTTVRAGTRSTGPAHTSVKKREILELVRQQKKAY